LKAKEGEQQKIKLSMRKQESLIFLLKKFLAKPLPTIKGWPPSPETPLRSLFFDKIKTSGTSLSRLGFLFGFVSAPSPFLTKICPGIFGMDLVPQPVKNTGGLKMRKFFWLAMGLFFLVFLNHCTTTQGNAPYQGAGLGAAVGATVGALIDNHNPWRGAVIGATAGAVFGAGITEISRNASVQAAQQHQPVIYHQGNTVIEATPAGYDQETKCHKIHKRIWEDGNLIEDRVEEVCEGRKISPTY
jgi:uncharacterized protein YqgC (DUF456 family)